MLPGDLARDGVCERIVERTVKSLGALDILVSNAAHQNHKDDLAKVTCRNVLRTMRGVEDAARGS